MAEQVHIPGAEHKASAELEGILAEALLPVTGAAGASARDGIGPEQDVEQIGRPKPRCPVSLPLFIDEKGKPDAGFFTKGARVVRVAKTDRCQTGARSMKCWLVLAQLCDVLAAKDSAIVPKKNENRRAGLPERAQANHRTAGVGQRCVRECGSKSRRHIVDLAQNETTINTDPCSSVLLTCKSLSGGQEYFHREDAKNAKFLKLFFFAFLASSRWIFLVAALPRRVHLWFRSYFWLPLAQGSA